MIRQNNLDARRKLLETRRFHFVVFFYDDDAVQGFELADENEVHILTWSRGGVARYYGVQEAGRGYAGHQAVVLNGAFDPGGLLAELDTCGGNIRPDVMAVLREGIAAYRPHPQMPGAD